MHLNHTASESTRQLQLTADASSHDGCRAEERKRKLREAAHEAAETGTDRKVFGDSEYMVGEDARTPNVHSRQVRSPHFHVCTVTSPQGVE